MKKIALLLSILSIVSTYSFSQKDLSFVSDGFSPFMNNPASTGSMNRFSTTAIYRNQWPSISNSFITYALALEADTKFGFKTTDKKLNMPIGLNVTSNKQGFFKTQDINIPISIPIELKNSTLAFGIAPGIKNISFHEDVIIIGEPYYFEESTKFNLNSGLFWTGENHYVGISVTNLTEPVHYLYQSERHYNFQAGYKFKVGQHYIYPMLNGTSDFIVSYLRTMNYFQFKEDIFSIGVGYDSQNALSFAGTVRVNNFKLAYVYYQSFSSLSNASSGSHEFRLSYAIGK